MGKFASLLKNKRVLAITAGVTTLLAGSGAGAAYWLVGPASAKEAVCFEWCEPLTPFVPPTTLTHLVFPATGSEKARRLFMPDAATCEAMASAMASTKQKGRSGTAGKCETVAVRVLPPPPEPERKAKAAAH